MQKRKNMPQTGNSNPKKDQITARVPLSVKQGLQEIAHERNGQDPYTTVTPAHVHREAVYGYLLEHWDEIDPETQKTIDRDRLKEQVDEGPGAGV